MRCRLVDGVRPRPAGPARRGGRPGGRRRSEFRVNGSPPATQSPRVNASAAAPTAASWSSGRATQDGSGLRRMARRFDANGGQRLGDDFLVNTYTTGNQYHPAWPATARQLPGGLAESAAQDGSLRAAYTASASRPQRRAGGPSSASTPTPPTTSPGASVAPGRRAATSWSSGAALTGQDGSTSAASSRRATTRQRRRPGRRVPRSTRTPPAIQNRPGRGARAADGAFVVAWQSPTRRAPRRLRHLRPALRAAPARPWAASSG